MTTTLRVRKDDLISRVYRCLDPKSRKKAITQKQIDGVITAFLAEIEASLASGNSVILKNHFRLEVEISPAHKRNNPQLPGQMILQPELRKVRLRLSQN
jgi:nucleoid DNA-binding protein